MGKTEYVRSKLEECSKIELSEHAKNRAQIRGIKPEIIRSRLKKEDITGVKSNENANTDIDYSETYLVLIQSEGSELYYLPLYFIGDSALITTVLKLSESNIGMLEW